MKKNVSLFDDDSIDSLSVLDELNQLLHNLGVSKNQRHSELIKIFIAKVYDEALNQGKSTFYYKKNEDLSDFKNRIESLLSIAVKNYELDVITKLQLSPEILIQIISFLQQYTISNNHSLMQAVFMKFGPQFLKMDMDQFFTPTEIVRFVNDLIKIDKNTRIVDPAGGSGDFLVSSFEKINSSLKDSNYDGGNIFYFDNSADATRVAKLNFLLNNLTKGNLSTLDSIANDIAKSFQFDYVLTNPPFGTQTIWSGELKIIENYDLAHKWKLGEISKEIFRQQLGILFIEKSMKILKDNGTLIIILPNGYLSNPSERYLRLWLLTYYRIVAVVSLPAGTFKKSGTGVSSVILIVKKEKVNSDYEIFTAVANKIGFDFNSKLNEKIYLRDSESGQFILDKMGGKISDNDLDIIKKRFYSFIKKNSISGFNSSNEIIDYEFINKESILKDADMVISPKRNEVKYINIKNKLTSESAKTLREVGGKIIRSFSKPEQSKKYYYLDIGKIGRGIYILDDKLPGWNLPGRAKQKANLYDIFVSRLNGSSNKFCMIVDDSDDIFVTNGMFKLAFSSDIQKFNFFYFLHTKEFEIQFNALATGSIMEDVKDEDFENKILIPQNNLKIYSKKAKKIIDLLTELKSIY